MLPESIRSIKPPTSTKKPRKATKPIAPMTTEQRTEMLTALPKEQFEHFAGIVAALGGESAQSEASTAAPPTDQHTTPTETQESAITPEFECVGIIARAIISKLIAGDLGAMLFDHRDGFSVLENVYLDITEAIEHALPQCTTADLKAAAIELSVR